MPDESSSELPAGRVGRAHGLDGSFYVTGARPRLLSLGTEVTVAETTVTIVRRAGTDRHPIVRLGGIANRAAAEALRGRELTVGRLDAPVLAEGEWWAHELEGCEVRDGERLLGRVRRLIELPSCEALEVERVPEEKEPSGEGQDARTLLVPMVKDAIRRVDVSGRRIDIDSDFLGA